MAERVLMSEFKKLSKEPWTNIELFHDNIFEWIVALIPLSPDSLYYGGYFKAKMTFPKDYPYSPPDFRFLKPLYHPNVYPDGRLCISILHQPGDDEMSGESAAERWSPVQGVESVLISIVSLLDDAELSSAANVDASVLLRSSPEQYKEKVQKDLETSKADIPKGFVMPTHEDAFKTTKVEDDVIMSWDDSDAEEDFDFDDDDLGGSESGFEDQDLDEDEEEEEEDEDEDDASQR